MTGNRCGRRAVPNAMHRFPLALLVVLAACSSGPAATTTTTSSVPQPTTTTTTAPITTTTTTSVPLEASGPEFDTWAIILESLSTADFSLEEAIQRASEQSGPADVLLSDDYPSLNPGFWVIFNGPYNTGSDADLRCSAMRAEAVACYTRYLGVSLEAAVGFEHGSALISVEGGFGIFDLDTGARIRTIEDTAETRYRTQPRLGQEGSVAFFAGNVEDYWYSCESAQGFIDRLDLSTGEFEQFAAGSLARVSPGGGSLAYVASSGCVTDPLDGGFLGTSDTIVVVDLTTDDEVRWLPAEDLTGQTTSFVTSLAWSHDSSYLLAVLGDGTLRRLEPAQPMRVNELPVVDATFVAPLDLNSRAGTTIDLVAGLSDDSIVAHRWTSIGSGRDGAALDASEIVEIDPRNGAVLRTLVALDSVFPSISLDASYGNLLVLDQNGAVIFDDSGRFPSVEAGTAGADW